MTKISRSKIDLFTECPRCFWLDVKHGVKRPPPAPYTINNAIDWLLKQEFDLYREKGEPHPVMVKNNIDAVPFSHPKMNTWRHNFTGVQFHHEPTDFMVFGAIDDAWVNSDGKIHVVDYKATGAREHHIYDSYKRQMEIYQWLLAQNGFDVSPTGYFVFAKVDKGGGFANGKSDVARLPFELIVEPQKGDNSWMPEILREARMTLDSDTSPRAAESCIYCAYRNNAGEF